MNKNINFSGAERRRFKRATGSFSVTYTIKSPFEVRVQFGLRDLDTIARDIGAGGIGLLAHDQIPQGTLVDLKFTLFNNASIGDENNYCKFDLRGEVRYSAPIEEESYHMGIRFISISPDQRSFIEKYIRDQN